MASLDSGRQRGTWTQRRINASWVSVVIHFVVNTVSYSLHVHQSELVVVVNMHVGVEDVASPPTVHVWRLVSRGQQVVYHRPCGVGQEGVLDSGHILQLWSGRRLSDRSMWHLSAWWAGVSLGSLQVTCPKSELQRQTIGFSAGPIPELPTVKTFNVRPLCRRVYAFIETTTCGQ